MKRDFESQTSGLEQILLFTILLALGLLPTFDAVWGDDAKASRELPKLPAAADGDAEARFGVDQVHAQLTFLSVPTELAETAIADWILTPLDLSDLAGTDPFAKMNQPLQRTPAKTAAASQGQVTADIEMRLPSAHKILNDEEARNLLSQLKADERTRQVFSPQMAFIDGMTATAVVGEKKSFIVGWFNDLPQTRIVPQGKMVRLRTVLDNDAMWLDYEIVVSRIRDVKTRSIRLANREQPVRLAVPQIETTTASANVELPQGGTLLVGGLPAESQDGVPHQLMVLIRAGRMRPIRMKRTVPNSDQTEPVATASVETPAAVRDADKAPPEKKRNPFSLISRILNRNPQRADKPQKQPARPLLNQLLDTPPQDQD